MTKDTKVTSYERERGYGTSEGYREQARQLVARYNEEHGTDYASAGPQFKSVRRALSGVGPWAYDLDENVYAQVVEHLSTAY